MVAASCNTSVAGAAARGQRQEGCLSVWSLKTFRRLHTLPLGAEPPAMNAIAFNHNGKIIAAASNDGMVRKIMHRTCTRPKLWRRSACVGRGGLCGP